MESFVVAVFVAITLNQVSASTPITRSSTVSGAEKLHSAEKLMEKSADLVLHDKFKEATQTLDEALALAPDYWRLHWQLSKNIHHHLGDEWHKMEATEKLRLLQQSIKHIDDAEQLYRRDFGRSNVTLSLDRVRETISSGRVSGNRSNFSELLRLLSSDDVQAARSEQTYVLALRGSIKTDLDDLPGALADMNEAIRLSPQSEDLYRARAYIFTKLGRRRESRQDIARFEELLEKKHHHFEHEEKGQK